MMRYAARKTAMLLFTLLLVTFLAFLAFQIIPGDPVGNMLGTGYTPERAAALRAQYGLDRPLLERYFAWVGDFVAGGMGTSYSYSMSVRDILGAKVPVTLALTALSFLLIGILSIPVGIFTAKREGGWPDRAVTVINQVAMAVPPFFLGMIAIYLFGLVLSLFKPGNFIPYTESVPGFLWYLFFPALAIAIPKSAMSVRLLRGSLLGELRADYVRTAYSKGNTRNSVLYRHVLKNAVVPVVAFLAMTIPDIVAGSIIIEQVFGIPGMGTMLISSIANRDYPVVQAIVVIIAFIVVLVNFLADLAYQTIDPRIRLS